ncbi:hypothetical protein BST18_24660 [Mycobacteroides abscessus subsp. bolletii]|nr:hypothetical protein BST18_24660 [Mycobacteroides abscessus subsp. bolletii]
MHPHRNRGNSLKRRVGRRPEFRTVVVFCEGKNSEPDYIKGVKRIPSIAQSTALNIEIAPERGVPLTLVKSAVERLMDPEVDECWCLFDVEWPKNHPNLRPAVELAKSKGVNLAVSNPCFEIWLLWHFKDHQAFLTTDEAERLSKACDGRLGKSLEADLYMASWTEARRRAAALADRHLKNGTPFPKDNPSSSVYMLIESLAPGIRT